MQQLFPSAASEPVGSGSGAWLPASVGFGHLGSMVPADTFRPLHDPGGGDAFRQFLNDLQTQPLGSMPYLGEAGGLPAPSPLGGSAAFSAAAPAWNAQASFPGAMPVGSSTLGLPGGAARLFQPPGPGAGPPFTFAAPGHEPAGCPPCDFDQPPPPRRAPGFESAAHDDVPPPHRLFGEHPLLGMTKSLGQAQLSAPEEPLPPMPPSPPPPPRRAQGTATFGAGGRMQHVLQVQTSENRWESLTFSAGDDLLRLANAFTHQHHLKGAFQPGLQAKMMSMIATGQSCGSVDIVDLI